MAMDIEVQSTAEALHQGGRAGWCCRLAESSLFDQMGGPGAMDNAQHLYPSTAGAAAGAAGRSGGGTEAVAGFPPAGRIPGRRAS